MKLNYYQDPGHGWIKAPKALLQRLGIAGDISHYSYMRGDFAYLEEDCDAARLFKAADSIGLEIKLNEFHTNKQSKIRSYDQYKYTRALEDFFKWTLDTGRLEVYSLGAKNGQLTFEKVELKK